VEGAVKENARPWMILLVLLFMIGCLFGSFVSLYWDEIVLRNSPPKTNVLPAVTPRITNVTADFFLLTVRFWTGDISRCDSLVVEISSKRDFSVLWPLKTRIVDAPQAGFVYVHIPKPLANRGWVRLTVESCNGERRTASEPVGFQLLE
jgi:hypothetical protein